jgi:hypothetical protein
MIIGMTCFQPNYLKYDGPALPKEEDLKEPFEPTEECKGWCNVNKQRQIAANLILDKSKYHNEIRNDKEWGMGMVAQKVPIERGRTIVYLY